MPKVIDLPTATSMDDGDYLLMEESSGGTKKITRANALSPIGTTVFAAGTATSLPNGTNTNLASLTLQKGTWIVVGQAYWEGSSTTTNWACISTSSASLQISNGGYEKAIATQIGMSLSRIITVSSTSQTIYLVGYQNSGLAVSMAGAPGRNNLTAVRIA